MALTPALYSSEIAVLVADLASTQPPQVPNLRTRTACVPQFVLVPTRYQQVRANLVRYTPNRQPELRLLLCLIGFRPTKSRLFDINRYQVLLSYLVASQLSLSSFNFFNYGTGFSSRFIIETDSKWTTANTCIPWKATAATAAAWTTCAA